MATIVLGIGTSHGPMLSTPPEGWDLRVPDDRRNRHHYQGKTWSFDELVALRGHENLAAQITLPVWQQRHAACRSAIAALAQAFDDARPDIAIVVGNDQMEIFKEPLVPAFSVLWGETIVNSSYSAERLAAMPPGIAVSVPGHIPPGGARYAAVPDLGLHLIRSLMHDDFDIAAMKSLPGDETPHAFGFVFRQVMSDRPVPSVPVVLNTFYPPNQPGLRRCRDFGLALARAIASWDSDARVALVASGGLSHFVIDEALDRAVLQAIRSGRLDGLLDQPEALFQVGSSEIKNWIPVMAAMAQLDFAPTVVDYVPCYRSQAGTGNAMGFVHWNAR